MVGRFIALVPVLLGLEPSVLARRRLIGAAGRSVELLLSRSSGIRPPGNFGRECPLQRIPYYNS